MTMTQTHSGSSPTDRLALQRKYRRLMISSILGGVAIALLLRDILAYPLVGEVVYWLGIVGFFVIWWRSPVQLFDERDAALERRASHVTIYVIGAVLVVGATTARVLPRISVYDVPDAAIYGLYAYITVFVVWAIAYLGLRYRP